MDGAISSGERAAHEVIAAGVEVLRPPATASVLEPGERSATGPVVPNGTRVALGHSRGGQNSRRSAAPDRLIAQRPRAGLTSSRRLRGSRAHRSALIARAVQELRTAYLRLAMAPIAITRESAISAPSAPSQLTPTVLRT